GDDGVTSNHPGGASAGPNLFQNYPVLTSVTSSGVSTTITGTLHGLPGTSFTLEFFANDTADPSGFGEGQTFLGQDTNVMTDPNGDVSFTVPLPVAVQPSQAVTATATDPDGNTSEFAPNVSPPAPMADLAVGITDDPDPVVAGNNLTYTITLTNNGPDAAQNVSLID